MIAFPVRVAVLLLILPLSLAAQLADPGPLAGAATSAGASPGRWMVGEGRANQALQAGFPTTAAAGYREILAEPALPPEARYRVELELVTALMDAGELAAAEQALRDYTGPLDATYRLRAGLLAAQARQFPQARQEYGEVKAEDLAAADRGWWFFLQAQLADADNDRGRRDRAYEEALRAAVSEAQRLRFLLAQEQARLRMDSPTEAQLATYRDNMERLQGTRQGFVWARTYATALFNLKRAGEAQSVLQRQLLAVPATERNEADQLRLMLGLIAGETSPEGRRAFRELLRAGQQPETQRIALYLLARGAQTPAQRDELRRDLGELVGGATQHPIIEDLLLVRARTALVDRQFTAAEDDARLLLERYPGSPLKAAALGVRLAVAWELKRYRSAADLSAQLRAVLPAGRDHAMLGVLLAESFFRSGDYANAADAYDAALREAPQVVPAGVLIFQRVLSDIRADRLDAAARLLDGAAGNPGFDAENRWQAEWNLVRAQQARGQGAAAQARVAQLLATGTQGVSDSLRIRLLWLRAKLSFDNDQADAATRQADELLAALPAAQIDAALKAEVASTAILLKAQALLALGQDEAGGALLDQLRTQYPQAKAAEYSYLVQAARFSARGETVKAEQLLIKLVNERKQSEFAPLALYEVALNLERRGLDDHLRQAYRRLEQLVNDYPRDELVFYARLKQGDLLRKLNDFGAARQFYDSLINNYGQHPDVLLAQLGLADSLFAQAGNSVVNAESAAAIYERLRDLPTAPVDLRAEAGFKWGYALAKRGQGARAQTVFWSVTDAFLLDAAQAAKLGAKGRYWLSRTLLELGQLLEDAGRLDEAQRAYRLILEQKLAGAAQAQAKLARFRGPAEERKP